jgi:hypothetical protein
VHRDVGADKESVVCLRSVGKKCPICEYREKRAKEGAEKEEIKLLYPRERSLYIVVPLGLKKYDEVPTIWDMSDYLFQDLLNDELDLDAENRMFPDLSEGKTLTLKLKWKQIGNNSFPEVRDISFDNREPYPKSILKEVPNLDEVLKVLTYEEVDAKLFEIEGEEDAGKLKEHTEVEAPPRRTRPVADKEEEEEEKPVRKPKPPKGSVRSDDEIEEEEKEEVPTPRRARATDENDAESAPARSRRRAVATEDTEEEKPSVRAGKQRETEDNTTTASVKHAKTTNGECPQGFVFGKDFEKYTECDECPKWNPCYDKSKVK